MKLSGDEQLEYKRGLMIRLAPVWAYAVFPFQCETKDYLGFALGLETPIIDSSMDNAFPGLQRMQIKLFASLLY